MATPIGELADAIVRAPHGAARVAMSERALRVAEAWIDDPEFAYLILLQIDAAVGSRSSVGVLAGFAQLTSWCERHPTLVDEDLATTLIRAHLPVLDVLMADPRFTSDHITDVLDRMSSHAATAGRGGELHSLANFMWVHHRGGPGVRTAFTAWQATARDECSACEACAVSAAGMYLATSGSLDRGIGMLRRTLTIDHECGSGHQVTYASLALHLLDVGDVSGSSAAARTAAIMCRSRHEAATTAAVGVLVRLCGVVGDVESLRALVGDHSVIWVAPATPLSRLRGSAQLGVALSSLTDRGLGDLAIDLPTSGGMTTAAHATALLTEATDLAHVFDRRAGGTGMSAQLNAITGREPFDGDYPPIVGTTMTGGQR